MKPWLILLNNFAHDLFTGLWFGTFLTLWLVRNQTEDLGEIPSWIGEMQQILFAICLLSLLLITLTGLFRFFYHRDQDEGKYSTPDLKRQMLIVKHAVLGSSFLIGTAMAIYWSLG